MFCGTIANKIINKIFKSVFKLEIQIFIKNHNVTVCYIRFNEHLSLAITKSEFKRIVSEFHNHHSI